MTKLRISLQSCTNHMCVPTTHDGKMLILIPNDELLCNVLSYHQGRVVFLWFSCVVAGLSQYGDTSTLPPSAVAFLHLRGRGVLLTTKLHRSVAVIGHLPSCHQFSLQVLHVWSRMTDEGWHARTLLNRHLQQFTQSSRKIRRQPWFHEETMAVLSLDEIQTESALSLRWLGHH